MRSTIQKLGDFDEEFVQIIQPRIQSNRKDSMWSNLDSITRKNIKDDGSEHMHIRIVHAICGAYDTQRLCSILTA